MANPNQEALNQVRALLRAYVRFGASIMVDTEGVVPAELYLVLQQVLGIEPGQPLPKEIMDVLHAHSKSLAQVELSLSEMERKELEAFWNRLKAAKNQKQLEAAEDTKADMSPNAQKAVDLQRRLRQSIATQLLDAWKAKNDPEESEEDQQDDGGDDDQHSDAQDMDEPSEDEADGQDGEGDDEGDDKSDGSGGGDGDDDGESDGQGQDGDGEGEPGEGQGQPGDGKGQPSDGKGQPGDGKGEPGEGQGEAGKGEGQGQPSDGEYQESNAAEDKQPGHDEWMEQLQKELEEQAQAEAEAEAEAEGEGDGDGEGDGEGDGKGETDTTDPNRSKDIEGVFDLSNLVPDPADVNAAKQALSRMIAKGLDNPTQLPRWKLGEFVKRQTTLRNLKGAKKPTLERKAVMFIIDNSPSMAHLQAQSRALAAALSATGGPAGADVVVALSFNGHYSDSKPLTEKNQDGAWFLNGKLMGQLPKPSKSSGVDEKHHGNCWKWFIQKVLPKYKVNVHLIGIYGDYDGTKEWCYISNEMKGIQTLWFNPENKELEGVLERKNPNFSERLGSSYGYVKGDRRFELFRGTFFTQVDTVQDIAQALRKVAGV